MIILHLNLSSGITVPEDYPDGELAGGQVITAKDGDE